MKKIQFKIPDKASLKELPKGLLKAFLSGNLPYYCWISGIVLSLVMSLVFINQTITYYMDNASNAMESGQQVVIHIKTGEIAIKIDEDEFIIPDQFPSEIAAPVETFKPVTPVLGSQVAVLIKNIGLSQKNAEFALKLPENVGFSLSPYAYNLNNLREKIKTAGHEIFLDLPMQTRDYPLADPGPYALLSNASKAKNLFRLKSVLSATAEYEGLLSPYDEIMTYSMTNILPIIDELKKDKIPLIYNERPSNAFLRNEMRAIGLPLLSHYIEIDTILEPDAITAKLDIVEKMVQDQKKAVLIVARPYQLTIAKLDEWLSNITAKGIKMSPVSALIEGKE